jgi:hypothetical protein
MCFATLLRRFCQNLKVSSDFCAAPDILKGWSFDWWALLEPVLLPAQFLVWSDEY